MSLRASAKSFLNGCRISFTFEESSNYPQSLDSAINFYFYRRFSIPYISWTMELGRPDFPSPLNKRHILHLMAINLTAFAFLWHTVEHLKTKSRKSPKFVIYLWGLSRNCIFKKLRKRTLWAFPASAHLKTIKKRLYQTFRGWNISPQERHLDTSLNFDSSIFSSPRHGSHLTPSMPRLWLWTNF